MKIIKKSTVSAIFFIIMVLILPFLSSAEDKKTNIIVFGDSLITGYGLMQEEYFSTKLQKKLADEEYNTTVVNSAIYSNTSAEAKKSIQNIIEKKPDLVILAVGYHDIYKGIFPDQTHNHLESVVRKLDMADIKVLVCGMKSPPKMSENFKKSFDTLFKDISDAYNTGYYPFFMEWVKDEKTRTQVDGVHPNAEGIDALVEGIFPEVKHLIEGKK